MCIKMYGCCTSIYVDLHTQGFGLRLSTAEIVFLNLYSTLHNRIFTVNIAISQ